uniref:Serine peptidase inhibitor, Kunitz type 1 b n=1 Tax=Xiphophorus couchianus TaxID=32473 RepID=A0A3B5MXL7_9TELE
MRPTEILLVLLLMPVLLLVLLLMPVLGGDEFVSGSENFVLDAKDAVEDGADLLDTQVVSVDEECETLCCQDSRCNLALLEPRDGEEEDTRNCFLFNCVHKNRFVCQFVNQDGYKSYIRRSMYRRYLEAPGEGVAPPIANAGPDVVLQPGENVTLNGSESVALHRAKISDYKWSQQSGDQNLKLEKTNYDDQVRLSNLQPGSYVLKLTVTDSKGKSGHDTVTIKVLTPELSTYCLAPLKTGPCRAAFPRWYYNTTTRSCEKFTYGGCLPNKNNFLFNEECMSACRGVTGNTQECGSQCRPDQLTCDDGCCLDRALECDGVNQCSDGSDEKLYGQVRSLLQAIRTKFIQCVEPPRTGPCRAHFTRWYYNPKDRKCVRFIYGGCDGNGNNFENNNDCSETCDGVTESNMFSRGMFDRSVTLAVILAVGILALLAIVGYCFLRRRRKAPSRSAGPAHVALSEQDTLVYNSTTKPA